MPARIRLGFFTLILLPAASWAAPPDAAKFFEEKVRPVLAEACWGCHGPQKQKGTLRLDSRAAMLKGGELGPSLLPGDLEKSRFLEAIRSTGELKMPPSGKLKERQIADLTAWIKMGAPWPDDTATTVAAAKTPASSGDLWSLKPVRDPTPPSATYADIVRNPIDRFLVAKLKDKGLRPAPPTDKRTLIRRANFDLIGMPPTPEEVDAFLKDTSPDAFAKVVDRLLASPAYGERWGRHWLDVARYADSNGMDENLAHGPAWRYRDWVIRAFNADLPFDKFVRLQIAGDLLPLSSSLSDVSDGLTATGFLVVGPKMLAEDDPVKMQMDIIDEQLDTVGQAFMGLTLGCARCHDHKFDPIPTADYYALAGIFKSTKTMNSFGVVAQWQERALASPADQELIAKHDAKIADVKKAIADRESTAKKAVLADAKKRVADYIAAAEEVRKGRAAGGGKPRMNAAKAPDGAVVVEAEAFARGNLSKDTEHYGKGVGVVINGGPNPNFCEYDLNVKAGNYRLEVRYAAADARPVKLSVAGKPAGEVAGRVTGGWFADKQEWDFGPPLTLKDGKLVLRFERADAIPHIDKFALVPVPPGEVLTKTAEQIAQERGLTLPFVNQWVAYLDRNGKAPTGDDIGKVIEQRDGPFKLPNPVDKLLPAAVMAELKPKRDELVKLEKDRPALPQAMAVSEQKPENLKVHIRGNHLTLGTEVPRGFLKVVALPNQPAVEPAGSGRRQLAEWLTRPDHPLTARVMANRLWLWHFGDGLVRTPDNFGRLGDAPVHPELLDWLASRFMQSGWSMKAMHRLIMASAAYQMNTMHDADAALKDPDNRLHGHWTRQRLDAESLRDSLLMLGGKLDPTLGGTLLTVKDRAYVNSTGGRGFDVADNDRRSVYIPVIRSGVQDVLQAWDFPDPSVPAGKRPVTIVPPQALLLMNSKMVEKQMRRLAERVMVQSGDDAGRVRWLYEAVYSRPAKPAEVGRAVEFLSRYEAAAGEAGVPTSERRVRAWQGLCRALVSSNEFVYVE